MENKAVFSGVCTALVTPFSNGKIDFDCLEELLNIQIDAGIDAVCVCGTTGEAATLSDNEQLQIIKFAVKQCSGKIKVIAGTGSNNTAHAVKLSRQASDEGVDAILVVTPYYNKATDKGLVLHYTEIANSVSCPVIAYNVPSRTGVDLSVSACKELSKHERIVGIKEASGNVSKTIKILAQCSNDFCVWCGNDDEIVPQMSVGANGVISVLSNLCPKQTAEMVKACQNGDYLKAAELQKKYSALIDVLFCEVNPIPIKEAMNLAGFRVGSPRLPLCSLSSENRNKLKTVLSQYGIA